MTQPIQIPAREHDVIRVFSLSMSDADAKALRNDGAALNAALGTDVDSDFVEVFPLSDLEGVGLMGYLGDGNDVAADQLAPDRAKLEKLGGWVLLVFSRAFRGADATLNPIPALTLIGTYGATGVDWRCTETVTSQAAKPYTAPPETVKKRPSDAAMSGRVATIVLILLGLFTWAMIWIAG